MKNISSVKPEDKQAVITKLRSDNLLYLARARILVAYPVPTEWNIFCSGNLALYMTTSGCSYLTVFSSDDTSILFSHELYKHFDEYYTKLTDTIYTFPSELCIVGIQFLLQNEAENMKSQIKVATPKPKKKKLFSGSLFTKKKKSGPIVISMPENVSMKSAVQWDPESGYTFDGSMEDIPKEHLEQMMQGFTPQLK